MISIYIFKCVYVQILYVNMYMYIYSIVYINMYVYLYYIFLHVLGDAACTAAVQPADDWGHTLTYAPRHAHIPKSTHRYIHILHIVCMYTHMCIYICISIYIYIYPFYHAWRRCMYCGGAACRRQRSHIHLNP